jgi:hypothetical protein
MRKLSSAIGPPGRAASSTCLFCAVIGTSRRITVAPAFAGGADDRANRLASKDDAMLT